MSKLDTMIRDAVKKEDPELEETLGGDEIANYFLSHSRLTRGFAYMKMIGTAAFALVSGVAFFTVDTTQAQIACAVGCLIGINGFGIWWLWYWMVLNRNSTLREIKRVELQLAEIRLGISTSQATGDV